MCAIDNSSPGRSRPTSTRWPLIRTPFGAAQVAHDDLAVVLGHATVMARDAERVEPGIALGVTADHDHRAIQGDVGPFIQGYQASGHGAVSPK